MSSQQPCFVALEPDGDSLAKVLAWKRRVHELVGPQLYLDDPPHLTLYLAVYPSTSDLSAAVERLAGQLDLPHLEMDGWHVFEADVLTNRNTLVCNLAPASRDLLRRVQNAAVGAVADLRDRAGTLARYRKSWDRLSEIERSNAERSGFPFVGPIWYPHVTVASIDCKDWDKVYVELQSLRPSGRLLLPSLTLYRLEEDRPVELGRWRIDRPSGADPGA